MKPCTKFQLNMLKGTGKNIWKTTGGTDRQSKPPVPSGETVGGVLRGPCWNCTCASIQSESTSWFTSRKFFTIFTSNYTINHRFFVQTILPFNVVIILQMVHIGVDTVYVFTTQTTWLEGSEMSGIWLNAHSHQLLSLSLSLSLSLPSDPFMNTWF